jgi:hypothetical protein
LLFRTKVDAINVFDSYAAMFALCDAVLAAIVHHAPSGHEARGDPQRVSCPFQLPATACIAAIASSPNTAASRTADRWSR